MNYTEMLNKIINESGLSNKEILEKCKELGEEITPNYLSVLKNNENRVASESLSRTLAKVCNARYEEVLVVQAYLDKAPEIMKKFIEGSFESAKRSSMQLLENSKEIGQIDETTYRILKEQLESGLSECSTAELLCADVLDNQSEYEQGIMEDLKEINKDLIKKQRKQALKNENKKKWILIEIDNNADIRFLDKEEISQLALDENNK